MDKKIAIVAIGYNRKDDFKRLVESLQSVDYQCDSVDLIMSIDNSGNTAVETFAKTVVWNQGKSIVRTFPERQGLRKHILQCGDYLNEYDALIVLEDDIVVSPALYTFAKTAVEKYSDDDHIAGISLYSHLFNVFAQYPFIPETSKFDAYFMQLAQSWGQIWLKKQWKSFAEWYKKQEIFELNPNIPIQLDSWGQNSWLKYHIKYCIENNKYFVYPYLSLTTCFSSEGEHAKYSADTYQVPMNLDSQKTYCLPDYNDVSAVYYDAFFERQRKLSQILGVEENQLCVDLYGSKQQMEQERRYILSSKALPYKVIRSFGRHMRPHEVNIIYAINGEQIFLYDSTEKAPVPQIFSGVTGMFMYHYRTYVKLKEMIQTAWMLLKRKFLR